MTALAADRSTFTSEQGLLTLPVAASVTIYAGSMVSLDSSGYARPARVSTTDKCVGFNYGNKITNGTTAGAVTIQVRNDKLGWFANSSGVNAIAQTDIGRDCYVADDQTVSLTDNLGARCRAGKIVDYNSTYGVAVDFKAQPSRKFVVGPLRITDVSASSDSELGWAPFAGKITKVWSVLGGAITGADAVVTPKIGSTAITGATLTIANSGSALGDVDVAHPTAANTVVFGSKLVASTDGASSTTATLDVFFEIEAAQ